jgi:hypothetical protein
MGDRKGAGYPHAMHTLLLFRLCSPPSSPSCIEPSIRSVFTYTGGEFNFPNQAILNEHRTSHITNAAESLQAADPTFSRLWVRYTPRTTLRAMS